MSFSTTFSNVFVLFALVFLGVLLAKCKVLSADLTGPLSAFIMQVTLPATIFVSMLMEYQPDLTASSLRLMGFIALFHGASALLGFITMRVFRIPMEDRGIWMLTTIFSSNGSFGYSLALALWGEEGLFLMAMASVVSSILLFSVGIRITVYGRETVRLSLRDIVFSNVNIALLLGLIVYFLQIPVPEPVTKCLDYLSNMTTGLSMLVIGLALSRISLRDALRNQNAFLLSAMRSIVIPLLTLLVLKLLGNRIDLNFQRIALLIAVLPAPSSASIVSEQYHIPSQLGAQVIMISTLMSLITIPLFLSLVSG